MDVVQVQFGVDAILSKYPREEENGALALGSLLRGPVGVSVRPGDEQGRGRVRGVSVRARGNWGSSTSLRSSPNHGTGFSAHDTRTPPAPWPCHWLPRLSAGAGQSAPVDDREHGPLDGQGQGTGFFTPVTGRADFLVDVPLARGARRRAIFTGGTRPPASDAAVSSAPTGWVRPGLGEVWSAPAKVVARYAARRGSGNVTLVPDGPDVLVPGWSWATVSRCARASEFGTRSAMAVRFSGCSWRPRGQG